VENDDSVLAADDLEFLRDIFRQNSDYMDVLNYIRSTKLNNQTLKQLHLASMQIRNSSEKEVRTQLHILSEVRKKFMQERKVREEADVGGYWKPIWDYIDETDRMFRRMLGSMLLVYDVDEEIIKKFAVTLENGYRKGDWKELVKEEDREAIKRMGVEFHTLCEAAGVRPEDVVEKKMREKAELDKKIALLELQIANGATAFLAGMLNDVIGDKELTTVQVRRLLPKTAVEVDKARDFNVKAGIWTMRERGNAKLYRKAVLSENGKTPVGKDLSGENG